MKKIPTESGNNVTHIISAKECSLLTVRLEKLRKQIGNFPDELQSGKLSITKPSSFFDINRFFEAFDKIRVLDGYTLDYLYMHTKLGGYPVPFTRSIKTVPSAYVFNNFDEMDKVLADQNIRQNHFEHLEFEDSPSGYFQFLVFEIVCYQFYLCWHSLYNDIEFVFSKVKLQEILESMNIKASWNRKTGREEHVNTKPAQGLILTPRIIMQGNDYAQVTTVVFSNWGGLSYLNSHMRWPNTIIKQDVEKIIDYDCGLRF